MTWSIGLSGAAIRTLDQVAPRVVPAVIEFLYGRLAENPERVGKRLRGDFDGLYSARRGSYRVIYEIDADLHAVTVLRIAHRSEAYRPR